MRFVLPELDGGRVIIIISGSSSKHLQKLRKNILMSFMNIFKSARNCSMSVIIYKQNRKRNERWPQIQSWTWGLFFMWFFMMFQKNGGLLNDSHFDDHVGLLRKRSKYIFLVHFLFNFRLYSRTIITIFRYYGVKC